jgi:hypothetical protein
MTALLSDLTLAATVAISALLPAGADVIEMRQLPRPAQHRSLVLWMLTSVASECPSAADWAPSCPDSTRGCFLSGPARLSLVDTAAGRLINTLPLADPMSGEDSFDLPRTLRGRSPYHVPKRSRAPTLLRPLDYNGDGARLEVAFFQAESCSLLFTALFGYSTRQDRLIQYQVRQYRPEGRCSQACTTAWPDKLFALHPQARGLWRYQLAYPPGDEPALACETRYLAGEEAFEERCTVAPRSAAQQ